MTRKFTFLILCVFVLVQLIHAAPTASNSTVPTLRVLYEQESEEELLVKNVTERRRLYDLRREKLMELVNVTLQEAKKYLKEVVKELKARESQYPALHAHIHNLTKFVDDMERLGENPKKEQNKDLVNYFEEFRDIYDTYETDNIEKLNEQVKMIKKLLAESDWNFLILGFTFGLVGVALNFENEVRVYVESLTEQQRQQESELIAWYNKKVDVDIL